MIDIRLRRLDNGRYECRSELRLARHDDHPLRSLDLRTTDPDWMGSLAAVVKGLSQNEALEVRISLAPERHPRRIRRRSVRRAKAFAMPAQKPATAGEDIDGTVVRNGVKGSATKVADTAPMFKAQVLIRTEAPDRVRALAATEGILNCFAAMRGDNWWRVAGQKIGPVFLGSDTFPWRRAHFDRRWRYLFDPSKPATLTVGEVAPFLRPAIKGTDPVLRPDSLGLTSLPTWTTENAALLVGYSNDEKRLIGLPPANFLFGARVGASGCGKSESMAADVIKLGRSGAGITLIDPHEDLLELVLCHLGSERDRIQVADLLMGPIPAYNPLDNRGCTDAENETILDTTVGAFVVANGWTDSTNGRAIKFMTKATSTLLEINRLLGDDGPLATIFQIPPLFLNEDFLRALLPHLPERLQDFWADDYLAKRKPDEALPALNKIDELAEHAATRAFFGRSHSELNFRRVMDEGKILLLCPGARESKVAPIVAGLMFSGLLSAFYSRASLPKDQRREHWCVLDELPVYANAEVAGALRQVRKYGGRALVAAQTLYDLPKTVRRAVMVNGSYFACGRLDEESAKLMAAQWNGGAGAKSAIMGLPKYEHWVSLEVDGQPQRPMEFRSNPVAELYGEGEDTAWARQGTKVLSGDLLEGLERRIVEALKRPKLKAV